MIYQLLKHYLQVDTEIREMKIPIYTYLCNDPSNVISKNMQYFSLSSSPLSNKTRYIFVETVQQNKDKCPNSLVSQYVQSYRRSTPDKLNQKRFPLNLDSTIWKVCRFPVGSLTEHNHLEIERVNRFDSS